MLQRRESVCRGRVIEVKAMKVPVEAVRVLIKVLSLPNSHSDCRGAQRSC
jgi:hypothetical protein